MAYCCIAHFLQDEHREVLVPILTRILYGKLMNRRGRAKQTLSTRRAAVMSYLAGLSSPELSHLFDILLGPFQKLLTSSDSNAKAGFDAMCSKAHDQLKHVAVSRRVGTLKMLHDVVKQLGTLIKPYLDSALAVEVGIMQAATYQLEHEDAAGTSGKRVGREQLLDLRSLATKEILLIFQQCPSHDFSRFIPVFRDTIAPAVRSLPGAGIQAQTPSALLQCLQQMTGHEQIMPLLFPTPGRKTKIEDSQGTELARSLIQCLQAKKIAPPVFEVLLRTLLNVLNHEVANGSPYIRPLVSEFLDGLRHRIDLVVGDKKRQYDALDGTLIDILCQLVNVTKDTAQITAIASLFVPFLKLQGILRKERLMPILTLFKSLATLLDEPEKFSLQLGRLWYNVKERDGRAALLEVFQAIGNRCEAMQSTAVLLDHLNSYSTKRLDEYDFDRRLEAYRQFTAELESRDSDDHTMMTVIPLMYQCFFDMADPDLSIRTMASSCLTAVVKEVHLGAASTMKDEDGENEHECANILTVNVMPMVKLGLKRNDDVIRDEFVKLLRTIVMLVPDRYPDMLHLTDENPEADIFNNIVHIQLHRRVKSLNKLKAVLKKNVVTSGTIVNWLIPLVSHYVYTPSVVVSTGGTRGGKDVVTQGGHNLATSAIEAIGEMCRHLPWGKYHRTLMYFLRATGANTNSAKALIRLTCSIADNFHFDMGQDRGTGEQTESMELEDKPDATAADDTATETAAEQAVRIEKTLVNRILPEFYKHLTQKAKGERDNHDQTNVNENDGHGIRQAVALTIIKLLQVLPNATLQAQVPRLVSVLTASLKSHLQSIRDEARATMVQCATSLGAHYMNFIIEDMRSVLLRGYQKHVLMYTIHSLLVAMTPIIETGELDYCLDSMLPILQDELVGEVSHEKEIDSLTRKSREYKGGGALDSYRMLAGVISHGSISELLEPIRSILATTNRLKTLKKADTALKRIAQGLLVNPDISDSFLYRFCKQTIRQVRERDTAFPCAPAAFLPKTDAFARGAAAT